MTLLQIKKPTFHIILAFLVIILLSFYVQVQAENTEKRDKAHALWEQGKNAFNERDYSTALEKFNNSLALYRETEDLQSEADLLTWMVATNIETNDFVKALNYLKKSKEIYKKSHSEPGEKARFKDVDKTLKALVLYTEGSQYKDAKDYKSAVEKFREALQLVREMGERQYEADIQSRVGIVQYELKNYPEAESCFLDALNIYREFDVKSDEGKALVNIAIVYFVKDEDSKLLSLSNINEALRIFEQINDKEGMAVALNWAGRVNYGLFKYTTAIDYYKKALALYEESGDKEEKAFIAKWLGQSYKSIGSFGISLKYFKQALDIIQEIRIPPQEGYILLQIGEVHCNMGDYQEALNAYNKAMQVFKELNSIAKQGKVLIGIGKIHSAQGNYLESIETLQKALQMFEGLEESHDLKEDIRLGRENALKALSEVHTLIGSKEKTAEYDLKIRNLNQWDKKNKLGQWLNLMDQGQTLENRKNFKKALEIYQQALDLSKEMNNQSGEMISLERIGHIYQELIEYPNAIEFQVKTLELSRKQNNKIVELTALYAIANTYLRQSDFINALDYFQHALEIAKETESETFEISALEGIGLGFLGQKNYEMAAAYYKEALIKSKEIDVPERIWRNNNSLGYIAQILEQFQKAKSYYSEAINTIESIRENISMDEYKTSFVENKLEVYRGMITVLLLLNEDEEAFNYVERAKSRSLLDLLGNRLKLENGKNKEFSLEETQLQNEINNLLERRRKERSQTKEKQRVALNVWDMELKKARKSYSKLLLKIKMEAPELHSLVSVNPLVLSEVQELLEPDTTLLEYYVHISNNMISPEQITMSIWIINKNEYKVVHRSISELTSIVATFREKIQNLKPNYEAEAEELYDLLIRPAKPYIKTRRICIVPHTVLHYLPFHALISTNGIENEAENQKRFLIEEYDIFYAPSASVLKFVLGKRKKASGKVLAFGNPELEDGNINLPYAQEEVESIKESYPDASIYIENNATEEKAKQLSGDYDIVHFASHGELNPESPLFSCIRMAKGKGEDGRLEVHEIFNLDLENTSLVTLSACETGLGKLSKGDELIGLTRAFIYAGTPSIVASLWNVNDESTSDLMSFFYKNLKTHSKVESLRMAQLEMINGEAGRGIVRGVGGIATSEDDQGDPQSQMIVNGSHPYFWAPFILLGDWK
jgi:Uncharacterized protein conserved in bacteria